MPYIIQKIVAYQQLTTTRCLLKYTGFYNHCNDQTIFWNIKINAQKFTVFLLKILIFILRPPECVFLLPFFPCT